MPPASSVGLRRVRSNGFGQSLPVDELHGVIVHASFAADAVNRHDVNVVQDRRGLCLQQEPLQLPGIQRGSERQYFERYLAAQGNLPGFIDDAHAAPAHFAKDVEIAQPAHGQGLRRFRFLGDQARSRLLN